MDLFIIPHVLYLPASTVNHYFQNIGLIQQCGIEFYLRLSLKMQKTTFSHFFSPVELRQATVAMMNRKDELEEQNAYVEKFCFSDAYRHAHK